MSEICPKCGLPKDLCVCESIAKEEQKIQIFLIKKKFGKISTVISGISDKSINMKELVKHLKTKLACGGTVKDGNIELQGTHLEKAKRYLVEFGFPEGLITAKGLKARGL